MARLSYQTAAAFWGEITSVQTTIPNTDAVTLDAVLPVPARLRPPGWLQQFDAVVIGFLNVALVVEIAIVFLNTMFRQFGGPAFHGLEETSRLLLVNMAFLGGAVAYGRGDFMTINFVADRVPDAWKAFFDGVVEWAVVVISALFGYYAIELWKINADEKTLILGIPFLWLVLPMTLGSVLFVLHVACRLFRLPPLAAVASGALVGAVVVFLALSRNADWTHGPALYAAMVAMFLALLTIGVPIGFVLGAIGILASYVPGSAELVSVVMNAQRGSGGFIFLALPFFILAGYITDRGDIGSRIVNFVAAMIGHLRGGMLQVMIVGVYISSGISGSKAADIATIGIPMNRLLAKHGYAPHERAAVLAAAAAMGESVPPSIAIIILGSVTSVSTGALFLAGFLPAAVVAACLMVLVYLRAIIFKWKVVPRAPRSEILVTGRKAIWPLLMPIILMGGIIAGIGTPTEVSTFAVLYGLGLGLVYRELNWRNLWELLTEASNLTGMIFFTVSAAMVFSWALTLEGLPSAIAQGVGGLGKYAFLPAVIILTVLLGALLESFVTIIILGPILLPVALQLGINPLQYGIILVEAFGIGAILPPVGIALYFACTICDAKVERASGPLAWYLLVMFVGLLFVAYIPWITTILPELFHFKN